MNHGRAAFLSLFVIITFLFLFPAGAAHSRVMVFEDAEDGRTSGWWITGLDAKTASVSNLYDTERQSRVIVLDSPNPLTTFWLTNTGPRFRWAAENYILQWSQRFEADFEVRIYVLEEGQSEPAPLVYLPSNAAPYREGRVRYAGLGSLAADGTWRTFLRDIEADFAAAGGPCGPIEAVVGLSFHGTGRVDDIRGLDRTPPTRPPVARDDRLETLMDTPAATTDVLANDEDPDGDAIHVSAFTQPGFGGSTHEGGGVFTYTPAEGFVGNDRFTYTVTDQHGASARAAVHVTVRADLEPQPEGSFGEGYQDLIPVDATKTCAPERFAVVTGLVVDPGGKPLRDVVVTVLECPGYGTASTDAQGRFSLPVEGGATLTLDYGKEGWIKAQRQVNPHWNSVATAETVVLISRDPFSTQVLFDHDPDSITIHRSGTVTDEAGSRSLTMVFTGDTRAFETDREGNIVREVSAITARATEFTTLASMPAVLPRNSAYTYCVEMEADGTEGIKFSRPIVSYVDNFLGFEVGSAVPVGSYDRVRGRWVPEQNGVVVRLLDTDGDGRVDALDATGDGLPDDLNKNGDIGDETRGLDPLNHWPEETLWRFEVTHFSPWDCNWPYGPPADAVPPNGKVPPNADTQKAPDMDCPEKVNSCALPRSRIYHDDIPIAGSAMTLHYASNRVPGYKHLITVPASGESVPESLKRIIVRVEAAGRVFEEDLAPLPNQAMVFDWDGLDYRGIPVGSGYAEIEIGFVYPAQYLRPGVFERAFAQAGGDVTGIEAREEIITWRCHRLLIAAPSPVPAALAEGWTLSSHHRVNPAAPDVIVKGDGEILDGSSLAIIETAVKGCKGELAADASGNIFISAAHKVCRVLPDQGLEVVAGTGEKGFSGDGAEAAAAELDTPRGIAFDNRGNLYIADSGNRRIRRVTPDGLIETIAGDGTAECRGDGGPAVAASLVSPTRVVPDEDGNLYVLDGERIRKIDPAGIITTLAGGGTEREDGGRAVDAKLRIGSSSNGLAVDSKGNVYVSEYYDGHCAWTIWARIRRIGPDGIIRTVAGKNCAGYNEQALSSGLGSVKDLCVDRNGTLYFTHYYRYDYGYNSGTYNHFISRLNPDGTLVRVAGKMRPPENRYAFRGYSGDGGPATEALMNEPESLVSTPSGAIFFSEGKNQCIRRVGPPTTFSDVMGQGDIPAADGDSGYVFSSSGDHLLSFDIETGLTVQAFSYDAAGRLVQVRDRFGNTLSIERQADGTPWRIFSPEGWITELLVDGKGRLTRAAYPDGGAYTFTYTGEGLLTAKTDPNGNRFHNTYDRDGRLALITDEEGGAWHFFRELTAEGTLQHDMLTAEGRWTTWLDREASTGYTSTITGPDGSATQYARSPDGLSVTKALACGIDLAFTYGLDPEYRFSYVKGMTQSTGGLKRTLTRERAYEDTDADSCSDRMTETLCTNGRTGTYVVDTLAATRTLTSPEGRTTLSEYGPETNLTTRVLIPGLHETRFTYDSRGRLTRTLTGERETSFSYDAGGNLSAITGPDLERTSYTHDAMGRISSITAPDGSLIRFHYDPNGNIEVLTNPLDIDHGFEYNRVNLATGYAAPLSGSYRLTYDRDRRLRTIRFPSGLQIDHLYENGLLTRIATPEGDIDLAYLCPGKPERVRSGPEEIHYGWEGGLLLSETHGGTLNQTLGYTYDDDFRLSALSYAGQTLSYGYDLDGLLSSAGAYTIFRNTQNGLPETVTGNGLETSRTFNGYGEITKEASLLAGGALSSWELLRDKAGRITRRTEVLNGRTAVYDYGYDVVGRLATVHLDGRLVEEYRYDENGRRIAEFNALRGIDARTYDYSIEDHLVSTGQTSFGYDLDGFLLYRDAGGTRTRYDYASRGELLSVSLPDGRLIEYVSDPLGRRIAKKIDGALTEKYLWQGLTRLLAVYDANDRLQLRFEYADGRLPVAMTGEDGVRSHLFYDPVGSLRLVVDGQGNVVKEIQYDAFGSVLSDSNPGLHIPLGFAGGLHDSDTGLVRFGFRDYDPATGRWTAKDPIGFAGGDTDLFRYVLNNPINAIDPYGLLTIYYGGGAAAYYGNAGNVTISAGAILYSDKTGWLGGNFASYGAEKAPSGDIETTLGAGAGAGPVFGFMTGSADDFKGYSSNLTLDLYFFGVTYTTNGSELGLSVGFGGKGVGFGYYMNETNTIIIRDKSNPCR